MHLRNKVVTESLEVSLNGRDRVAMHHLARLKMWDGTEMCPTRVEDIPKEGGVDILVKSRF